MKKGKQLTVFLLALACFQIFLIVFLRRGIFLTQYDKEYWKDRYEHSQYQLPASQRALGDDGLYAYSGYRLIKGDDPFSINVDKPPAGKYLIGLSILIFGNPAFSGLVFGLGSIVLFFLAAKQLLNSTNMALFLSLMLLLDPMIFSQFWVSTYDIIQLFFLLLNIFLLIQLGKQLREKPKKANLLSLALAAGISLGVFTEIKPPLTLPLVLVLEVVYFFHQYGLSPCVTFLVGLILGAFLPYLRYVQLHSLFDFFKIHKFMANFYLQSKLKIHRGAIWQVIFLGQFPHITSGQPLNVTEWWLIWPLATIGSLISFLWLTFKRKLNFFWLLLGLIIAFSLLLYSFIPAYSRYLVLILPFIYLITARAFTNLKMKTKKLLGVLILSYGLINSISFLPHRVDDTLVVFYYNFSKQYFHDIYKESLANSDSLGMTQEEFRSITQSVLQQAEIEAIKIQELQKKVIKPNEESEVALQVTYKTRNLGEFTEEKTVKLIAQKGQWKIVWDWNILLNGFRPGYSITTNIQTGKRGRIIGKEGLVLVEDTPGYLISVNPDQIDPQQEGAMLEAIHSVSFQAPISLQNAYLENSLPNSFVPLVTNFIPLTKAKKQLLTSYPGLKLESYPARAYYDLNPLSIGNTFYKECCTRIYSASNYEGLQGVEKEKNKILKGENGGELIIKNENAEVVRVIIKRKRKDGHDVWL